MCLTCYQVKHLDSPDTLPKLFRGKFSVYFAKVVFTVKIEVEKVPKNPEGQQITGRNLDH
jgi:hypothetical protein